MFRIRAILFLQFVLQDFNGTGISNAFGYRFFRNSHSGDTIQLYPEWYGYLLYFSNIRDGR